MRRLTLLLVTALVGAVVAVIGATPEPAAAVGPTDTDVLGSPNPSFEGQTVVITAKVTAEVPPGPVGAVFFFDGDVTKPIGTGVPLLPATGCVPTVICSYSIAQISTSELSVGSHTIIAVFPPGVSPDLPSRGTYTQVVNPKVKARTSTQLTSSPNPSAGQAVTFTATVSNVFAGAPVPTGSVQLMNGGSPFGVAQHIDGSGRAQLVFPSMSPGTYSLVAVYSGDDEHLPSESNVVIHVVREPSANLGLTKSCSPTTVAPGETVNCRITVTNSGPSSAQNVEVTDDLPAGLTMVGSASGSGFDCPAIGGSRLICTKATQPVGPGSTIAYTLSVGSDVPPATPLTNRASVASRTADPDRANNLAEATVTTVSCGITGSGDILGTPGDDVICGSPELDRIAARGGNDTIFGKEGNDRLDGGDGNDRLLGGTGDDQLIAGPGDDTAHGNDGKDYLAAGEGFDRCFAEFAASCEQFA